MQFVRQGRPETRAETAALVGQCIAEHAATGFAKWRLVDLDDHLVGRAGSGRSGTAGSWATRLWRDLWGQGLATDIGAALVSWHLIHAADCPLCAYVAVDNPASRRVLEKIGLSPSGERTTLACRVNCVHKGWLLIDTGTRLALRSIRLRRDLLVDVFGGGDRAGADPWCGLRCDGSQHGHRRSSRRHRDDNRREHGSSTARPSGVLRTCRIHRAITSVPGGSAPTRLDQGSSTGRARGSRRGRVA